ncbi:MAG TPA: hypothetical protein VGR57_03715 [Ktedonobacterales bacterium]|nr:hypothetical protein [Ktedonobacterales bacterium]
MKLRAGWRLPWRRAPHTVNAAPILMLARDWLVANGARIEPRPADVVTAHLADGTHRTYAATAGGAREPADVLLLAPGAPARDELLAAIARAGIGQALCVPAGAADAVTIARAAITTLDARKHPVVGDPAHQICPECLEREGRLLILGSRAAPRLRCEGHDERATVEAVFALSVRTHRGSREEVARFAVDAATGAPLPPLGVAQLARAVAAAGAGAPARAAKAALPGLAAAVALAAGAAGRLARLQSLPDYQRRQADIAITQERLLVEAPNDARAILKARQGELDALATAHGVTVTPRLLALTPISEPFAEVRAAFAGGGTLAMRVDLARATIEAPRCVICATPWRVGARCAEGHITCQSCQQVCGHCGARRCSLCAVAEFAPCAACEVPTCARCARDTARGRHPALAGAPAVSGVSRVGATEEHTLAAGSANELTLPDLDHMTPTTWRTFVRWYLLRQGYRILAETVDDEAHSISFECQPSPDAGAPSAWVVAPGAGAPLAGGAAALVRQLTEEHRRRPGAHMLVVTRLEGHHLAAIRGALPWLTVVDQAQLLAAIQRQAEAFGHTRQREQSDLEARAAAAAAVQATLRSALAAAAAALAAAGAASVVEGMATATSATERIGQDARLMRQVVLACETLVEDWLGLFGTAPTRANGLAIERDSAAITQLDARASHLDSALRAAAGALAASDGALGRAVQRWHGALCDELALQCRLLASKAAAVAPEHWRDFEAAHPASAVDGTAALLAAWQRAGLRTRRLRDECAHAAAESAPDAASRA